MRIARVKLAILLRVFAFYSANNLHSSLVASNLYNVAIGLGVISDINETSVIHIETEKDRYFIDTKAGEIVNVSDFVTGDEQKGYDTVMRQRVKPKGPMSADIDNYVHEENTEKYQLSSISK